MPEDKNKLYTIIALVAVGALLLGCIAGALAGGIAGLVVADRQAQSTTRRMLQSELGTWSGSEELLPGVTPALPVPVPFGRLGALVVEVLPGTPAEGAGLQVGDLILTVDRTPIDGDHPLPDVISLYEPGDRVTLQILRAGQRERVQVRLDEHPDIPGQAYLGIRFEMVSGPGNRLPQD